MPEYPKDGVESSRSIPDRKCDGNNDLKQDLIKTHFTHLNIGIVVPAESNDPDGLDACSFRCLPKERAGRLEAVEWEVQLSPITCDVKS
jgi:hypothetical protein